MKKKIEQYGVIGFFNLILQIMRTKLFFKNARIIRFPFRVRGKRFINVGKGFTTGFNCRMDAFNFDNFNRTLIDIGGNVQINDYVHIAAINGVTIEDNVLIASKVFITDHNHGSYSGDHHDSPLSIPNDRKIYSHPVLIKRNVWIGEFVCILPGVTIGEGSIIGAMSVVTKDIPPNCIAVGSPARVVKQYNFDEQKWLKV
ncbi:acetyltransferase [Sphingobacterium alkalisoli]|uniref:Acetyltransferase n=1 Tax=Sphingobacterium alkalisoli TaxID=1874115 RepID=A0A4U0GMT7_9SPHI|nr:acetyltransferase [Sphingobacterium alkalisoli]TJY60161.1 acetyltransferase [Sphingobacterium alkalisoli]GGH32293.1 putative lipopolysaccharide biosynthesis O-acetyl transferase WbbJ [Sphingobacterium alkalisoli]